MTKPVTCGMCGFTFPDNPKKHGNREKYCPQCLTPYKKALPRWKPNLRWIRERVARRRAKQITQDSAAFYRIRKKLIERTGKAPTLLDIRREYIREAITPKEERERKWEKTRRKLRK